jgi:hypothetical protein
MWRAHDKSIRWYVAVDLPAVVVPKSSGSASALGVMPYKTRIIVRRPMNPRNFAGVAVVDWQNVTAGHDIDTEWSLAGQYFVRAGWMWVGASTQRVGVHGFDPSNPQAGLGLIPWSPSRYGSLDVTNKGTVTDDSPSYDIYTQIARFLKHPAGSTPLAPMPSKRVNAGGGSQSAGFLVRYYNGVQPLAGVYDGFLIGLSGGAPRLDVPAKFFKVHTESDVWRGQAAVRVPDSPSVHTWQIAGASHVSAAMYATSQTDFRAILMGVLERDLPKRIPSQCIRPYASNV